MSISVLISDDAEVVRSGIKMMLRGNKEIQVVGEASSFSETILKFGQLKPDVLLFDLRLAEGRSAELKAAVDGKKILAISFATGGEADALVKDIGAGRFIDKMKLVEELIPAILQLASSTKSDFRTATP